MRLFALQGSKEFGDKIAAAIDREVDAHEERNFDDGEHKIRPLVSVRDEDCYVVHSLYADALQSVNDKLTKLLFFIATLKDDGAKRVTAVVPYLCYARKDRRTKARDPVTIRYVAQLFEAVGVDRVVTIDVHNLQAFQNSFRCETEHLEAQQLFVNYFQAHLSSFENITVMSPDIGGVKRAENFRDRLAKSLGVHVDFAFIEKLRSKDIISGEEVVVGNVSGKTVIVMDDLIAGGTTMRRAAVACARAGATEVYAVATHGAFIPKANEVMQEKALKKIIVTNTITRSRLSESQVKSKLEIIDVAPFFAETIRRLNTAGSLVALMDIE